MTYLESTAYESDLVGASYIDSKWVPDIQSSPRNRKLSWRRPISRTTRIDVASELIEPMSVEVNAEVAVLNNVEAEDVQTNFHQEKLKLFAVLGSFHEEGYSTVRDRENKISKQSMEAAVKFIQLLPPTTALPQILPDGEEGVILAWVSPQKKTLLTIDNWSLHGVENPGSPDATYFDDLVFRGNRIPSEILLAVDATKVQLGG